MINFWVVKMYVLMVIVFKNGLKKYKTDVLLMSTLSQYLKL